MIPGKASNLDGLATLLFNRIPAQCIHTAIAQHASTVVDLAVGLQGTVVESAHRLDEQHHVLGGVPAVKQHVCEGQGLVGNGERQHLLHMIELGLAIALRVEDAVIDDPILSRIGIDVQAVDHANALDQAMLVAAVLQANQLDGVGMLLVQDGVIEHQAAAWRLDNIALHMFPEDAPCELVAAQQTIDCIVAQTLGMIGEVGHRKVGVRRQKKLTVIDSIDHRFG